jgi:hypothetical protein
MVSLTLGMYLTEQLMYIYPLGMKDLTKNEI